MFVCVCVCACVSLQMSCNHPARWCKRGMNYLTSRFGDITPTHNPPYAFAQLASLLKVDLSKASQLPKAELAKLCGVFAVFPEDQRKMFSLCSAKLKAAIETAPKLCPKSSKTVTTKPKPAGSGSGAKKPMTTKKPGSGSSAYAPKSVATAWKNHFEAFGSQNLDKIMLDYTDVGNTHTHTHTHTVPL